MNKVALEQNKIVAYRPCAGAMVINRTGKVWVGKRSGNAEHVGTASRWQMPQGGIEAGEDPRTAAVRELYEETSVRSARILAESSDWLFYDLPISLIGIALRGKFRGQKQKWFLFYFFGDDTEINILSPANGEYVAEFDEWKWVEPRELLELTVEFKRPVYEKVLAEFEPLIEQRPRL